MRDDAKDLDKWAAVPAKTGKSPTPLQVENAAILGRVHRRIHKTNVQPPWLTRTSWSQCDGG